MLRGEIEVTPRNVATRQRVRKGADDDDDVGLMSSDIEVCMQRIGLHLHRALMQPLTPQQTNNSQRRLWPIALVSPIEKWPD